MLSVIKNKFFSSMVSYYNGHEYPLKDLEQLESDTDKQHKVLIVSPSYVTQTEKKYPITERRELKKLLELQQTTRQFYIIKDQDEHGIRVTHWDFNQDLPKAWLYLPESLIIQAQSASNEIMEIDETTHSSYYFSSDQSHTFIAQKSSIMNSPERFSISTGVQYTDVKKVTFSQKLSMLLPALGRLQAKHWYAFLPKIEQLNWWPLIIKSVIPATALILVYTLFSSAYLFAINTHYNDTLSEQSEDLSQLLSLQQKIDESQAAYSQLQTFLGAKQSYLALWLELAPLFEYVDLDSIQINGQRIQIRGQAEQATRIMELLTNSPNVAEAKFDSSVSKTRRAERFIISFTLTNTLVLDPKFSSRTSEEGTSNE